MPDTCVLFDSAQHIGHNDRRTGRLLGRWMHSAPRCLCISEKPAVKSPKKRSTEHSAGRRRGSCGSRRPAGRRRSGETCSPSTSGWRRRRRPSTLPSTARIRGRRWWSFWASRRGRAPPFTAGRCTRSHARCLHAWLNELDVKPYRACTLLSDDLRPCTVRGHTPGAWNYQLECITGSTLAGFSRHYSPYGNSQVCSLCRSAIPCHGQTM